MIIKISNQLLKKILLIGSLLLLINSCKLVDSPIEPPEALPTRNVRYLVTMTSSSANSNPQIAYTNSSNSITTIYSLTLDVTEAIDSGSTVNLDASCMGFYSTISGMASAGIEMKIYIADTLAADSSVIKTDNITSVTTSASLTAQVN